MTTLSDQDKALPIRVKAMLGGFRLSERLQDMTAFDRFVIDKVRTAGWTKPLFLDSDQDRQWQYFFYHLPWVGAHGPALSDLVNLLGCFCRGIMPITDLTCASYQRDLITSFETASPSYLLHFAQQYDAMAFKCPDKSIFVDPLPF